MVTFCVHDDSFLHQRQAFIAEAESFFNVRDFAAAGHQTIERLADMLPRDEVEGVRLQRPADLMARDRKAHDGG